jgi:flagellar operon protein
MVDAIGGLRPEAVSGPDRGPQQGARLAERAGTRFDAALAAVERSQLEFSKHAMRRIEQRGLRLDDQRIERLEQAVGRAQEKGSRDSLILLDELALVVSVRNRTVVTAMDESSRSDHVFTNIDSVVIAES